MRAPQLSRTTGLPLAILILVTVACSPKYYAPNAHHLPLLRQAGEGSVSATVGDARFEAQASASPRQGVGLLATMSSFHPEDDDDGDGGHGYLAEVGVSSYGAIHRRGLWEVYGLLAVGRVENHFPSTVAAAPQTTGSIQSQLLRAGLQSAVGWRSRHLDGALSLRLVRLQYFDTSGNLEFDGVDQVRYLRRAGGQILIEPAVTVRLGDEPVKVEFQVGRSFNLTDSDFPGDDSSVSVGLRFAVSSYGAARSAPR